jgi:hypothetical protein
MELFANGVGTAICFVCLAFIPIVRGIEQWRHRNLLVGVGFIVVAALALGIFTDMAAVFDALAFEKKINPTTHDSAKRIAAVWAIILPAVVAGLGVNMISNWIAAPRPRPEFAQSVTADKQ